MLLIEVGLWLVLEMTRQRSTSTASAPPAQPPVQVDFKRDVQPILQQRCQPCHFPGGSMYAKLPFDQPQTIDHLGAKLFTRIKKEKEQQVIRAFLER